MAMSNLMREKYAKTLTLIQLLWGKVCKNPTKGTKPFAFLLLSWRKHIQKPPEFVVFCVTKSDESLTVRAVERLTPGDPYKTRSSVLWKKRHQGTLKKPQGVKRFLPMAWFQ